MKPSNYMTRALQCRDRRYAVILGKLGYSSPGTLAAKPAKKTAPKNTPHPLTELRKQYHLATGKSPVKSWDAETLVAKIAEAKDAI